MVFGFAIYVLVFLVGLSFLPQTLKFYKMKNADVVSALSYSIISLVTLLITCALIIGFLRHYYTLENSLDIKIKSNKSGLMIFGILTILYLFNLLSFLSVLYCKFFKWNKKT